MTDQEERKIRLDLHPLADRCLLDVRAGRIILMERDLRGIDDDRDVGVRVVIRLLVGCIGDHWLSPSYTTETR